VRHEQGRGGCRTSEGAPSGDPDCEAPTQKRAKRGGLNNPYRCALWACEHSERGTNELCKQEHTAHIYGA